MADSSNHDLKILLEEMHINMQQSLATGDTLDQKINTTLATGGLILALISTLQITLSVNQSNLYWVVFFVALILCIIPVVMALVGMNPQEYNLAVKSDWVGFEENFFGVQEKNLLTKILSNYIKAIEQNQRINSKKVQVYRRTLIMLSSAVMLFLLLTPISALGL